MELDGPITGATTAEVYSRRPSPVTAKRSSLNVNRLRFSKSSRNDVHERAKKTEIEDDKEGEGEEEEEEDNDEKEEENSSD